MMKETGATMVWCLVAMILFGMISDNSASMEDTERALLMSNFPYGRGVDNDLEVARVLIIPERMYHPKRNSELINSLLSLPKNMNNAGRK